MLNAPATPTEVREKRGTDRTFTPQHVDASAIGSPVRALAPNTDATWTALSPVIQKVFAGYRMERASDSRELFQVSVTQP
jgi:hypothetical protein